MNTKTIIGIVVLLIIVLGGGYLVSQDSSSNGDTIKIGFIGALSGDAAAYGEPQRNILDIAVDEINQNGGIHGRSVEVIYEDGKCDGAGGANAAQKLVNVDKVQVIIGGTCSSESLSAIPIVESGKVALITGSATSPDLIGKSPYFARTFPNDFEQGVSLAGNAYTNAGYHHVAVLVEQTPYALGIVGAFSKRLTELGGTVSKEEYSSDITDFRSPLQKLKAKNPDALFLSVQTTAAAERILKQLNELGWKPELMVNDIVLSDAGVVEKNKSALEGSLGAMFFLEDSAKLDAIRAKYQAKYGVDIPYANYTTAAYDAFNLVVEAIQKKGYDGTKIALFVRTTKSWPGASGALTIGGNGERQSGFTLFVVKEGKAVPYTK